LQLEAGFPPEAGPPLAEKLATCKSKEEVGEMKKIWVNKAASFEEAEKFDEKYYREMSETARLETVQLLREEHYKFSGGKNESRKGLRRSVKVIQRARS